MEECVLEIRRIQSEARKSGKFERPRWPMIVLRSPKGWTGPKEVDGHKKFGIVRSTFIIDRNGVIRHALYNVNYKGHALEVLRLVKELNS